MLVPWIMLAGCNQDLLLSLGDPTGINAVQATGSIDAAAENIVSTTALLIRSSTKAPPKEVPPTPEAVVGEEAPVQAVPAAAPKFNPISVPEDPPETTGTRFPGVKSKGTGRLAPTVRMGKNGVPID